MQAWEREFLANQRSFQRIVDIKPLVFKESLDEAFYSIAQSLPTEEMNSYLKEAAAIISIICFVPKLYSWQ